MRHVIGRIVECIWAGTGEINQHTTALPRTNGVGAADGRRGPRIYINLKYATDSASAQWISYAVHRVYHGVADGCDGYFDRITESCVLWLYNTIYPVPENKGWITGEINPQSVGSANAHLNGIRYQGRGRRRQGRYHS